MNTCRYLRAESAATAVDDASKRFIAAMRQNVSLQPSTGTRGPTLHLAALPLTDEIVAASLRVDVLGLRGTITHISALYVSLMKLDLTWLQQKVLRGCV